MHRYRAYKVRLRSSTKWDPCKLTPAPKRTFRGSRKLKVLVVVVWKNGSLFASAADRFFPAFPPFHRKGAGRGFPHASPLAGVLPGVPRGPGHRTLHRQCHWDEGFASIWSPPKPHPDPQFLLWHFQNRRPLWDEPQGPALRSK